MFLRPCSKNQLYELRWTSIGKFQYLADRRMNAVPFCLS